MPTPNPEAVRQRAIAAARQRIGQLATPTLDPVIGALNPNALPARPRSPAELHQWVRRDEEYAILGANVVVELNSEGRARQPTTRAWAIIRRAERARHPSDLSTPWRAAAGRPCHPQRPHQPIPATGGAGDGCRCPLIASRPEERPTPADSSQLILIRHIRGMRSSSKSVRRPGHR
jgi:hypothetical protein